MIEHAVEQNSQQWYGLRLGIPTASNFHRIITPTRGELSKQADKYAYYLIAERVLHQTLESTAQSEFIELGKQREPDACDLYEMIEGVKLRKVGFFTTDDQRIGCSPDRFIIGTPGGALECKCPAPQTHIGYLLDGPGDDYRPQVQGQILVCELDWVDFFSFHPLMPPVQRRFHRDAQYIARMVAALDQFNDRLEAMVARVRQEGYFEAEAARSPGGVQTPLERFLEEGVR